MRTTFTAACICLPMLLPARVQAAPLTDRAIAASENMLGGMLMLLEKCVPSLAGKLGEGSLPLFSVQWKTGRVTRRRGSPHFWDHRGCLLRSHNPTGG